MSVDHFFHNLHGIRNKNIGIWYQARVFQDQILEALDKTILGLNHQKIAIEEVSSDYQLSNITDLEGVIGCYLGPIVMPKTNNVVDHLILLNEDYIDNSTIIDKNQRDDELVPCWRNFVTIKELMNILIFHNNAEIVSYILQKFALVVDQLFSSHIHHNYMCTEPDGTTNTDLIDKLFDIHLNDTDKEKLTDKEVEDKKQRFRIIEALAFMLAEECILPHKLCDKYVNKEDKIEDLAMRQRMPFQIVKNLLTNEDYRDLKNIIFRIIAPSYHANHIKK